MLTFEQKLAVIETFNELQRKNVSLGRINFQFEDSIYDKKNVVYHLHPNGNGFVYAEHVKGYAANDKGMVNIRDFSEEELRSIIKKSIHSLSVQEDEQAEEFEEEKWTNEDGQTLILIQEDDMWNVYAGLNLDGTFTTYKEAANYLHEEGFKA
ncbi:hypothetical protein M4D55_16220 [Metabacillus idriensis]|uniref:Uncharacterized protein n=1 Tax=Metabacillus idriensis TaxID=324768 RepID=A0A6I2M9U3_9BACI|nr:hypothetical protein [Metabacillus idriensis]MCM3597319.1 hypothetical protein [Metabacillus idriensis]MRX54072.1 hypothetical protein [Metabacillus idriensis]OHR73228.1 hypothetical protein HMPREF3291_20000 [Bacillus sp. HMSC76G11]